MNYTLCRWKIHVTFMLSKHQQTINFMSKSRHLKCSRWLQVSSGNWVSSLCWKAEELPKCVHRPGARSQVPKPKPWTQVRPLWENSMAWRYAEMTHSHDDKKAKGSCVHCGNRLGTTYFWISGWFLPSTSPSTGDLSTQPCPGVSNDYVKSSTALECKGSLINLWIVLFSAWRSASILGQGSVLIP